MTSNSKYLFVAQSCASLLKLVAIFSTSSSIVLSDGLYTYKGSDSPDVSGNNGRPKNNLFESNVISNTDVGVFIKQADDNTFNSESRQAESSRAEPVAVFMLSFICLLFVGRWY